MRIERLHIDGFGHYHDHELGPLDGAVTLIRGDNEAGKSTLLAFVRAVLFGFPQRLGAQHYSPLRGGAHGGRITLRLEDSRAFTVQRHQGRGRGPFEARAEDGEVLSEAQFLALIGNASETLFREAYTFDLDDMIHFDASGGDLGGLLYGVSMGAERLPRTLQRLEARIDDLFKPGGSNQAVAGLLRDLEETDAHLREVATQAVDYRRLSERRDGIAAEIEAAGQRLDALTKRQQELDRHQRAWDDWAALRVIEERLARLEDTACFPADGVARLDQGERDLRAADEAREEAARDLEVARTDAALEVPDAALLDHAEAVDGLRSYRGAVAGSLRDLPERRAELRSREDDLARRLTDLGPGWDEDRLLAFDLSIPRRADIEDWQQRFEDGRTAVSARARDAEAVCKRLDDAPDHDAVRTRADALRRLRSAHDTYERARVRLEDLQEQAGPAPVRARPLQVILTAGSALLLGAIGWLLADIVGAAAAGVLGGVLGHLAARVLVPSPARNGPSHPDRTLDESRAAFASAESVLRGAATDILGDTLPDAGSIEVAEAALERDRPLADERARAELRATEAARALERAQRRLDQATEAHETAREVLEATQREWETWLAAADLPRDLAPRTADALLATVDASRTRAEEVREWRRRVAAIEGDIRQYRARVESVAHALGLGTVWPDDHAAVQAADALIARFESARNERTQREQARATVDERERVLQTAERRRQEARYALDRLLVEGDVADVEAFRRRATVHDDRRALERDRADAEMRLHQLIGPDAASMDALDAALRQASPEAIEADRAAVEADLATAREQHAALLEERGRVATHLERLHDDETASEVRAQAAVLRTELQARAREWSSLILARALLRLTRERYERERQPAVIQRASDFFRTLTGDRYVRLYQSIGDSTVTVEDRDGARKIPDHLSRGTKEQLYLALRLGAIEEAAKSNERLPVIVDEVLVNFDETRARRAVQAFVDLSQHTQVIVFTCHPWVAALFQAAAAPQVMPLD